MLGDLIEKEPFVLGHIHRDIGYAEVTTVRIASEVPVLRSRPLSSVASFSSSVRVDLPDHDFVMSFVLPSLGFNLCSLQIVVDGNKRRVAPVLPIQVLLHQLDDRGVVPRVFCLSEGADADSFSPSCARRRVFHAVEGRGGAVVHAHTSFQSPSAVL